MNKTFTDNALTPIIAFDFDNTLTIGDYFPKIGHPRTYAKKVVNLLHDLGVTVLIWTCRDSSDDVDQYHDDISPAIEWLGKHGFRFHDVNTCIKYAPFHYEARKIYAHMYVDDRAFGWQNRDDILLDVLVEFLYKHMGMDKYKLSELKCKLIRQEEVTAEWVRTNCI